MQISLVNQTILNATLAGLLLAAPASAFPGFFNTWKDLYAGSSSGANVQVGLGSSCALCHASPTAGDNWNRYGWDMREHMAAGLTLTQALQALEGTDSDGDPSGSTNLAEIQADTQPGWRAGPHNTLYFSDFSTLSGQVAPSGILGLLDPGQPAIPFCPGDGTVGGCPCSNEGGPAQGCANSSGSGVLLEATGSNSLAAADLAFEASGAISGEWGVFFQGAVDLNAGAGMFHGDGLLCAGGAIVRLQLTFPSGTGETATTIDVGAAGRVLAGQTRYYQYWYRDTAGPCSSGSNLSNGLEVTWTP